MKKIKIKPLSRFIARGALAMMMVMMTPSFAGASETAETEFTANIQSASCTVKSDSVVNMGEFPANWQGKPAPFDIKVNCSGTVISDIWAEVIKGTPYIPASIIYMEVSDGSQGASLTLYEKSSGRPVDLSENGSRFCSGNTTRVCTVEPQLLLSNITAGATASAVVRFNLEHK
ncbi:fimbrial protein [Citrobacter meridianamericanus]|uniref:Fimbrial protein n=1 Tax=Citrobacter meridianamericanus TaxID=2894201 RepID=A0ABT1BEF9_9ENTR|nr:hypothetical protein [Citrobacter meridianamericanus]MCO5784260.1 hypothetical protein [Citrobacter meridianamericanus]